MSKRILAIIGGAYISGAERVTLDVIKGLKKAGFSIHCVVSGWNDGEFIHNLERIGLPYTPIKLGWYYLRKPFWSIDSLLHYPKAILNFLKLRNTYNHDYVYIISFRQIFLLFPFFKKNIIYHVHDPNANNYKSKFFINFIDKKVFKYIAVSNYIKQDLIDCGIDPQKIEVIHNGVFIEESDVITRENLKKKIISVGIVGQIIPRKGHEDVIKAFNLLKNDGVNIKLIIVGKGDTEFIDKLKGMITHFDLNDRVIWKGYKTEMSDIYEDIDVLLAPSQTAEPFALVALEANALSIPVIVSNQGGFEESVLDNHNGYVIEAFRPDLIAQKIKFLYTNQNVFSDMQVNGYKRVLLYFTHDSMILKIQQLLEKFNLN